MVFILIIYYLFINNARSLIIPMKAYYAGIPWIPHYGGYVQQYPPNIGYVCIACNNGEYHD